MEVSGITIIREYAKYRINTKRYQLFKNEYPKWLIEKYAEAAWKITAAFIKEHRQELKDSDTDVMQLRDQLSIKFRHLYFRMLKLRDIANKVLESSLKQLKF